MWNGRIRKNENLNTTTYFYFLASNQRIFMRLFFRSTVIHTYLFPVLFLPQKFRRNKAPLGRTAVGDGALCRLCLGKCKNFVAATYLDSTTITKVKERTTVTTQARVYIPQPLWFQWSWWCGHAVCSRLQLRGNTAYSKKKKKVSYSPHFKGCLHTWAWAG